ncbi:hypothetical protein HK100_007960 [Physocladia obscura]|uniref:GH16 domain-containing protein n=1 Tax=Physocladia obscura TaxID=109957 RepID=A0AAD5TA38_9FUNG|nr:hypothetical protein HK100_007960 [Physocladia obscura]
MTGLVIAAFFAYTQAQIWNLVFHDTFEGNTLNSTKWNIESTPCYGESEWYLPENVAVSGGNLVITPKQQTTTGAVDCGSGTTSYTKVVSSGRVNTQDYGCWKCENQQCSGSNYLEIDIVEAYNGYGRGWTLQAPPITTGATFYEATVWWDPDNASTGSWAVDFNTPDLSTGFHNYTTIWLPGTVEFLFDGTSIGKYVYSSAESTMENWCGNLILNVALGGSAYGNPTDAQVLADASIWTPMLVDEIWVFQTSDSVNTITTANAKTTVKTTTKATTKTTSTTVKTTTTKTISTAVKTATTTSSILLVHDFKNMALNNLSGFVSDDGTMTNFTSSSITPGANGYFYEFFGPTGCVALNNYSHLSVSVAIPSSAATFIITLQEGDSSCENAGNTATVVSNSLITPVVVGSVSTFSVPLSAFSGVDLSRSLAVVFDTFTPSNEEYKFQSLTLTH